MEMKSGLIGERRKKLEVGKIAEQQVLRVETRAI